MSTDLKQLVIDDIDRLGYDAAALKYSVHRNTIVNWMKGKASPGYEALQLAFNERSGSCTVKQEVALWEGRKLMVAMPIYRDIQPATVHTLIANYARHGASKIGFIMTQGITLLEEARNSLVERFLASDAERILFLDDDVVLPCGNADILNGYYGMGLPEKFASKALIDELWNHDKDIVGALYFGRNARGVAQYSEAFQSKEEDKKAHDLTDAGLQETKWAATGALMVKRQVFEKIKEMAPQLWPNIIPQKPGTPVGYFNRFNSDMGEDVSMAYRARELGFKCYVDRSLVCGHIGPTIFGPNNTAGRAE